MRTRSDSSVAQADPGPASSIRRALRPRRAAQSARGRPATDADVGAGTFSGATTGRLPHVPRISGRVTRSAATYSFKDKANPNDSSSDDNLAAAAATAPPLSHSTRPSRSSHNRPAVPPTATQAQVGGNGSGERRLRKRTRRQSGFYEEDTDDEAFIDNLGLNPYLSPSPEVEHQLTARTKKASEKKKPKPLAITGRQLPVRPSVERHSKPTNSSPQVATTIATSTNYTVVIPEWASLPYFVLVQIFRHASDSLADRERVNWLLSTSHICRTFAEPALTVLYQCPPLLTRAMAHNLVGLLSQDPGTTLFKYRQKVEKLRVDVREITAKTHKGQPLDLWTLVNCCPRLKVIDFHHEKDLPPFRTLDVNLRWHYPDSLFQALNGNTSPALLETKQTLEVQPTRLAGWRWNRRMLGRNMDLPRIKELHATTPFANLKKLCFVNFQVPSLNDPLRGGADDDIENEIAARDHSYIETFAATIGALANLEYLSIESSTVVNDYFLPLLPKTLRTLELINCWDVNGEDFAAYLLSHGHKLEHLYLHNNQSLNLSFLTVLGEACPNLQTLCMDLKTYNHHEFYRDSDPSYDDLLTVSQVPTWPETIETIELRNMRKWSADAAETFFRSLVDSAPKLTNLRSLVLKAMLDIPFRQRSVLRDKWAAKLTKVFLRKNEDPLPHFTLRPRPIGDDEKQGHKMFKHRPKRLKTGRHPDNSPPRRSGRLNAASSRASSVGRELRNGIARPSYVDPDSDIDQLEDDDEDDDVDELSLDDNSARRKKRASRGSDGTSSSDETTESSAEHFFRHGLCEKVEIQLDNQKPREETFGMDDFLDDEADDDDDGDWDGNDWQDDDAGYAW